MRKWDVHTQRKCGVVTSRCELSRRRSATISDTFLSVKAVISCFTCPVGIAPHKNILFEFRHLLGHVLYFTWAWSSFLWVRSCNCITVQAVYRPIAIVYVRIITKRRYTQIGHVYSVMSLHQEALRVGNDWKLEHDFIVLLRACHGIYLYCLLLHISEPTRPY